ILISWKATEALSRECYLFLFHQRLVEARCPTITEQTPNNFINHIIGMFDSGSMVSFQVPGLGTQLQAYFPRLLLWWLRNSYFRRCWLSFVASKVDLSQFFYFRWLYITYNPHSQVIRSIVSLKKLLDIFTGKVPDIFVIANHRTSVRMYLIGSIEKSLNHLTDRRVLGSQTTLFQDDVFFFIKFAKYWF